MLAQPGLVKLGQISYGVYLWHDPVYRVLRAHLDWPLVVLLGSLISVGLATLSFVSIERWARRWRDRPAHSSANSSAEPSADPRHAMHGSAR